MSPVMYLASVIVFYLLGSSAAHLSFYLNETETTRLLGMTSYHIIILSYVRTRNQLTKRNMDDNRRILRIRAI